MNMNKQLGRFKQWAGERMGAEARTNVSDDFKALETEMGMREDGLEKMHRSMTAYVKGISKRTEGDDKEKSLPIAHLGGVMVQHGEDFDSQSEFGRSLTLTGKAHEKLARAQDSYSAEATASWLEALERNLNYMKEYHNARKKLESRRLAYDATQGKLQKAKKEDFRVEEELRTNKVKYEDANEAVYRRMLDIQDAESENMKDLSTFVDAELNYHERCYEVLLQLKNELPMAPSSNHSRGTSRARPYQDRYEPVQEELSRSPHRPSIVSTRSTSPYQDRYEQPVQEELSRSPHRPSIISTRSASSHRLQEDELPGRSESTYLRPTPRRNPTFDSPTQLRNNDIYTPQRSQTDLAIRASRTNLRPTNRVYSDEYHDGSSTGNASPYDDRSETSGTPPSSYFSHTPSISTAAIKKKGPPPPPPSRATKPQSKIPPVNHNLVGA